MPTRLPWFKCYPEKLLGALAAMPPIEGYIYVTILLRIYERGGPIPDTPDTLSRRTGIHLTRVERALKFLEKEHKINQLDKINGHDYALIDSSSTHPCLNLNTHIKNGQIKAGKASALKRKESTPAGVERALYVRSTNIDIESKKESSLTKEDSQNERLSVSREPTTKKRPRKRIEYPPDYDRFWKGYPTDTNMSKAECYAEWQKLDSDDRVAAEKSLPGFRAYCSSRSDYRPIHAIRYLSKRRFEGHLATAEKILESARVFVLRDSPQGDAWDEFLKRTKGKSAPRNSRGGWYFPSEYPDERHAKDG